MITGKQLANYWYKEILPKYVPIVQTGKMDAYLEKQNINPNDRGKVVDYWWKELNGKMNANSQKQKLAAYFDKVIQKKQQESISLEKISEAVTVFNDKDLKLFSQQLTKLSQAIYNIRRSPVVDRDNDLKKLFDTLSKAHLNFQKEANTIF